MIIVWLSKSNAIIAINHTNRRVLKVWTMFELSTVSLYFILYAYRQAWGFTRSRANTVWLSKTLLHYM